MAHPEVRNSIVIHAPIAKVWDALVNPLQTKKYMFGCEAISSWKPGGELLWRGEYNGVTGVFVKGHIVEIQPPHLLKYTVIGTDSTFPDIPENYLNVTYSLSEQDGQTTLTVVQDGFETAAEGEKRYKDAYNNGDGWNPILHAIKQIVEEGGQ